MMNRDSGLWWLALAVAFVGYLQTVPEPPVAWSYQQWLNAVMVILAWVSGKLATSPLKGRPSA